MKKQGFSLVELLVSVMVISIIAVAFAPVVTKKLSKNMAVIGSKEVKASNVQPGYKLFKTTDPNPKKVNGDSYEFEFVVPENVTKLSVVAVGGGSGGGGAAAGVYRTDDKTLVAGSTNIGENGPVLTVTSNMSNFLIADILSGGGGGGMGDTGMPYTNSSKSSRTAIVVSGGGGASGYYFGNCTFNTTKDGKKATTIKLVAGAGGAGSRSNTIPGGEGGESYVQVTYCENPTCEDETPVIEKYRVRGGAGGTGALISRYTGTPYTYAPDVTYEVGKGGESGGRDGWAPIGTTVTTANGIGALCYKGGGLTAVSGQDGNFNTGITKTAVIRAEPGAAGWISSSYFSNLPDEDTSAGSGGAAYVSIRETGYSDWGVNGRDGYVKLTYKESISYDGAAGAAGYSGGLIHVKTFPVTPGETCTVRVGKGGAAGVGGSDPTGGEAGGSSQLICGSGNMTSGNLNIGASNAGQAGTATSDPVQGVLYINNISNPSLNIGGRNYQTETPEGVLKIIKPESTYPYQTVNGEERSYGALGGWAPFSPAGGHANDGKSLEYKPPTSPDEVMNGYYGLGAGGGGGGGSWKRSGNKADSGGKGTDGYVFIYWGY